MTTCVAQLVEIAGSQVAAARLLRVSQPYVSQVCSGLRAPSAMAELLARILVERPAVRRWAEHMIVGR